MEVFGNQQFFCKKTNIFTLSGIDNGYKSSMSIGHVLLINVVWRSPVSEVLWNLELQIKDCGHAEWGQGQST